MTMKHAHLPSQTMPGYIVAEKTAEVPSSVEDVHVWEFQDTEFWRYGQRINVRCDHLISDDMAAEILQFARGYGEITESAFFFPSKLRVKFKHPGSVFKMFYEQKWSGVVRKTLQSGIEISINTVDTSQPTKCANAIKFTNVVRREGNLLAYLSRLLDLAVCNPGIIKIDHDDSTRNAWVDVEHPWYVRDVSCKVHQFLISDNVPEEYRGVGVDVKSPYWPCEYKDNVSGGFETSPRKGGLDESSVFTAAN